LGIEVVAIYDSYFCISRDIEVSQQLFREEGRRLVHGQTQDEVLVCVDGDVGDGSLVVLEVGQSFIVVSKSFLDNLSIKLTGRRLIYF
jgi:hypothetical protein